MLDSSECSMVGSVHFDQGAHIPMVPSKFDLMKYEWSLKTIIDKLSRFYILVSIFNEYRL